MLLLVGAGLFVRSLSRAQEVDLGIEPARVLTLEARWPPPPLDSPGAMKRFRSRRGEFYLHALARAQRLPGVERASLAVGTPFGSSFTLGLHVPGWTKIPSLPGGGPYIQAVSPGYLATAGLRLSRGRGFAEGDRAGTEPVALVNETMAKMLWPQGGALGRCLHILLDNAPCTRVVGVVEDAHRSTLDEPPAMQYYVPLGQEVGFGGPQAVGSHAR